MPIQRKRVHVPYREARRHILDADVLMYSGRSLISRIIRTIGRSRYSHAALAGWTNGDPDGKNNRLMAYEMLWKGGCATCLSAHADKWPGKIDVYRVSDTHTTWHWDEAAGIQVGTHTVLDRKEAVTIMRDFCRPSEYGDMHLLWASFLHLPLVRFFVPVPTDDDIEARERPPFCSEAVAYALRKSFTDVVRNTPDHYTEPGDLARSPLLHYLFTLV